MIFFNSMQILCHIITQLPSSVYFSALAFLYHIFFQHFCHGTFFFPHNNFKISLGYNLHLSSLGCSSYVKEFVVLDRYGHINIEI